MNDLASNEQLAVSGLELDPSTTPIGFTESVPLPNEEFEPFLADYANYDTFLEHSLGVQDLEISQPLPATLPGSEPNIQSTEYSSMRPEMIPRYAPAMYTTPGQESEPSFADFQSSPTRAKSFVNAIPSSPTRLQDKMSIPTYLPSYFEDIPSSPPSSPTRYESLMLSSEPDPLGIQGYDSRTGFHNGSVISQPFHDAPAPPFEPLSSPPCSPRSFRVNKRSPHPSKQATFLDWQPILTIPEETQTENEEIIRRQVLASEIKSKRRSCLPPGTVDEYIGGPHAGGIYECLYPQCNRLFRRRYNLRSHIQTHLCDRPYRCEDCDATFVRPHDLRRHSRCHSNSRPFKCPCGKGFTRMDALQRHRYRMICKGGLTPEDQGDSPRKRTPRPMLTMSNSPELLSESDSPVLKCEPQMVSPRR